MHHNISCSIHVTGIRAHEIEADWAAENIAALRIYILYMQQDTGRMRSREIWTLRSTFMHHIIYSVLYV